MTDTIESPVARILDEDTEFRIYLRDEGKILHIVYSGQQVADVLDIPSYAARGLAEGLLQLLSHAEARLKEIRERE